jgi:hypothetical protein
MAPIDTAVERVATSPAVEEYDDGYDLFKALERDARERLAGGRRHLFEAEMKESNRTHGQPGHEATART